MKRKLSNVTDRMALVCDNRIKVLKNRLDTLASARQMQNMMALVDDRRMALAALDREMETAMEKILTEKKNRMLREAAKLDALSPLAVLTRGYSALFDETGKSVHSKEQLRQGDVIRIRLSDGAADAEIKEVL